MGEEAKSELQRAAGKIEGVTAFTKMELPKPPREFATNRPHRYADPLHGGAMDNPVMLASGCSIHQSYQQTLPSEEQIQDILKKFSGHSELQKEAIHLRQAAKRVLGVTRNSSAPRMLRQEQACSDVASTSGSVPSANQSYEQWFNSHKNRCHPNEVAVKWSSEDDDASITKYYGALLSDLTR